MTETFTLKSKRKQTHEQETINISQEKQKKTKRQHIKELKYSIKNKWVSNHPHMKSMEKREKAYLFDANIHPKQQRKSKKNDKNKSALEESMNPELEFDNPELKFGRYLGSSCEKTRHKSLIALQNYLKERCVKYGFTELDLLKCWKGLWYCLYMADKSVVHDEVSKKMAELLWCFVGTEEEDFLIAETFLEMMEEDEVGEEDEEDVDDDIHEAEDIEEVEEEEQQDEVNEEKVEGMEEDTDEGLDKEEETLHKKHFRGAYLISLFLQTFFQTCLREWPNIDKYRIDKFYTLIRYILQEMYSYLAYRQYHQGLIQMFNDILYDHVLFRVPNGVRMHVCDVVLDELVNADLKKEIKGVSITTNLNSETFLSLMEPFFEVCSQEPNEIVHERCMENVFEKFLEFSNLGDGKEKKFQGVEVEEVADAVFALASSDDGTIRKNKYRQMMYDLYKLYSRYMRDHSLEMDDAMDEENQNQDDAEKLHNQIDVENEKQEHNDMDMEVDDSEFHINKKQDKKKGATGTVKESRKTEKDDSDNSKEKSKTAKEDDESAKKEQTDDNQITSSSKKKKEKKQRRKEKQKQQQKNQDYDLKSKELLESPSSDSSKNNQNQISTEEKVQDKRHMEKYSDKYDSKKDKVYEISSLASKNYDNKVTPKNKKQKNNSQDTKADGKEAIENKFGSTTDIDINEEFSEAKKYEQKSAMPKNKNHKKKGKSNNRDAETDDKEASVNESNLSKDKEASSKGKNKERDVLPKNEKNKKKHSYVQDTKADKETSEIESSTLKEEVTINEESSEIKKDEKVTPKNKKNKKQRNSNGHDNSNKNKKSNHSKLDESELSNNESTPSKEVATKEEGAEPMGKSTSPSNKEESNKKQPKHKKKKGKNLDNLNKSNPSKEIETQGKSSEPLSSIANPNKDEGTKKLSQSKKKKQKNNQEEDNDDDSKKKSNASKKNKEEKDEVIVISTKQQHLSVKDATTTTTTSTQEKSKKKTKKEIPAKKEKKVKWNSTNRSKTYSASMRGLRSPKIAQIGMKSPDKSILLKK